MFADNELIISHACSGIYVEYNDFSGRANDVFDPLSNAAAAT